MQSKHNKGRPGIFFNCCGFFFKVFLEINVDGQPKQTHRFTWWFYQMALFLHKKSFKLIVLALRQSNSPVRCLEQKAKEEVGQRFEAKFRKTGKAETRTSWQDTDINVGKKPTIRRRAGSWSKDTRQIWYRKIGWSKSGESHYSCSKKLTLLSAGHLPSSCRETIRVLLLGSPWYYPGWWRIIHPKGLLVAVATQTIFAMLSTRIAWVSKEVIMRDKP